MSVRAPCVVCDRWTVVDSPHDEAVCDPCRDPADRRPVVPRADRVFCKRCKVRHVVACDLPWCAADGR